MNKSSKAWRALDDPVEDEDEDDFVSRSTVVRGSNSVHVLRASFGEMRAGIVFWHSNGALVSKLAHWAQVRSEDPQRTQVASGLHAVATVSS